MNDKNFITHPTIKTLIVFTLVYLLSISLLVYASFDDDGNFERPNFMLVVMVLLSIWQLLKLYRNYFKNMRRLS